MYFGYAQMYRLPFVPVGFTFVMVMATALALIYVVGATRGAAAARTYLRNCAVLTAGGLTALVVWAIFSGQWMRFLGSYGALPLVEMGLLAFMLLASLMMLATSYVHSKRD